MINIASARAVISYNGTAYTAAAAVAKDLGDFVSDFAGFTQKNLAVGLEALKMTVLFRPDTTSDRWEVVFELGRANDPAPANLGPYSVEILLGTTLLRTVAVPLHYWGTRWRWQSAVRPQIREFGDIPAGLLPPMKAVKKKVQQPPVPAPGPGPGPVPTPGAGVVFTPMDLAGITAYMPGTGERPDIGLVTGLQGQWLETGAEADYAPMMAQAEASASIPWHIREVGTGGIFDCALHPMATLYQDKPGWEYIAQTFNPVTVDISHQPALCYLPYLLTGDPYFLEEMQFATNHSTLQQPPDSRLIIWQTRGFAWRMRNIAQCAAVTPMLAPAWLLPGVEWERQLEEHRSHLEVNYINSTDPVRAVLRTADDYVASGAETNNPAGTHTAPWQDEFCAAVFGWVWDLGFDSWAPVFDWQIGSTIARTSGSSGWPKEVSTPYRMNVRNSASAPLATSWAEAWGITQGLQGTTIPVPGQEVPGTDPWYITYTRGSLVYAKKAGYDVGEALAWIESELVRLKVNLLDSEHAKWAVEPS